MWENQAVSDRPNCPVCGAAPWAERIYVGESSGIDRYVDGLLHCPNENDEAHFAYWRQQTA